MLIKKGFVRNFYMDIVKKYVHIMEATIYLKLNLAIIFSKIIIVQKEINVIIHIKILIIVAICLIVIKLYLTCLIIIFTILISNL
jgi:hypothetical protein